MSGPRVPLLLAGHALKSLRDSGYSLAAALGEVVDNSLEANANVVEIRLQEAGRWRRKRHIHRIAVADDGDGMDPMVLHHYLQLGFSTRYMSTTTIGKYGVGAKLAALNFATRIDVWSRTSTSEPWRNVHFDLDEVFAADDAGRESYIEAPSEVPVPRELVDLLPSERGTLVVWSNVDRLEEGRFADDATALRSDVAAELSRMFRYFLHGGITLRIDGTELLPHDPLFVMTGTWADRVLREHYARPGVEPSFEAADHYPGEVLADDRLGFRGHHLRLRVAVHPPAVLRTRGTGDDDLAQTLGLAQHQGALSLVRLDREINYASIPGIVPTGVQETDRFIGVEITFPPDLDDYMGVRNVKRGVEPHGELRSLIRRELRRSIAAARERVHAHWGDVRRRFGETHGEHRAVLEAAAKVDRMLPKRHAPAVDPRQEEATRAELARDLGLEGDAARQYVERAATLPFLLETVDLPGEQLVRIDHLSHQVVIRLNERHPLYREVWEPLRDMATAPRGSVPQAQMIATSQRAIEALTLLVLAYGKAESVAPSEDGLDRLHDDWGRFLATLMEHVNDVL